MFRILVFCALLLTLPLSICSAELYQNRDYNIQMNVLDGWKDIPANDGEFFSKGARYGKDGATYGAFIKVQASYLESMPGATFDDISAERQRKDLDNLYNEWNDDELKVTESNIVEIGGKTCYMLRITRMEDQEKCILVIFLLNRYMYTVVYRTNDPSGVYENHFFNMLSSFRSIY